MLHENQKQPPKSSTEGEPKDRTHTTLTTDTPAAAPTQLIALRTVPLYLINGTKKKMVNALLDDASTKTYLNADVAAELGLEGSKEDLTVNVLNDNQETFPSSLVEFRISSLNGKTSCMASAFTTQRVTGNMKGQLEPVQAKVESLGVNTVSKDRTQAYCRSATRSRLCPPDVRY